MEENKLVIMIDGLNTFFRSYAVDPSINSKGEHVGGYKGFVKQLQKFCREMRPHDICVVWDGEGGSKKRKQIKKDYKEGRKSVNPNNYNRFVETEMSEEEVKENKTWQLQQLVTILNEMPVRQFLIDHVEADDIIAHLATKCYEGWNKIIVSNDKDFLQLADDYTVVYRPCTKKYMNKKDVVEKHKIHPTNMALARAILGDASDNLPGVKGVGPKTLTKLFPTLSGSATLMLDDMLTEISALDKKEKKAAHKKIEESIDIIELNYKMMQLYNPRMSTHAVDIIDSVLEEDLNYSKFNTEKIMIEDGFAEYNWTTMYQHFASMMYEFKKHKKQS